MKRFWSRGCAVAACGALGVALVSCGNDEETAAPAPVTETNAPAAQNLPSPDAAQQTPEAEPELSPAEQTRQQIFDLLVYNVTPRLATPNSPLAPQVKETLRLLNELYDQEKDTTAGTPERTRLAFTIAEMRSSFGAWDSALMEYSRALEDLNSMSDEQRATPGAASTLSSIYLGKAFCYLKKGNFSAALEQYDLRLQNDENRAASLFEPREQRQMTELEAIVLGDLISSMRTRAECLSQSEPEEARTAFAGYIDRVDDLMWCPLLATHMQYIRLVSAAANLESRCNNADKAIEYCNKIIAHCSAVHDGTQDAQVRQLMLTQVKGCRDMIDKLNAGEQVQTAPVEEEAAPTEPLQSDLPELPSAEPAAAVEPAPVPEVAPAAEPVKAEKASRNRSGNRKNRRG